MARIKERSTFKPTMEIIYDITKDELYEAVRSQETRCIGDSGN